MNARDSQILDMYLEGYSTTEVGSVFGLTRQRVHQIVSPYVEDPHYGYLRRQAYTDKIRLSFERIVSQNSTVRIEAELLQITPDSLRRSFVARKLRLPKREHPLHGTRYRYNEGCRCDECKRVTREYQQTFRGKEPPIHGTISAYTNYACRCEDCIQAGRDYRERRKAVVSG